MENDEPNILERLGIILLVALIISSIFEVGLLIFAYLNADKVECNLLWCTFTTESTSSYQSISSTSECYVNGVKINCSEFPTKDYEHFYSNERYEMNGVCPSPELNLTIAECIERAERFALEDTEIKDGNR